MIDFKINGLSDIARALDELPTKIEQNVLRGGLRAGSKVIATDARDRIHKRSGLLAKSVHYGVTRGKLTGLMGYVRSGKVKGSLRAWWARFVEFGTAAHVINAKPGGAMLLGGKGGTPVKSVEHPGAAPHPYMRPALDARARDAVEAAAQYMRDRLRTQYGIDIPDPTPLDRDETP